MQLKEIIESIKTQNTKKEVILANPNDERVLAACKTLLSEGHSPVIAGSKDELEIYKWLSIKSYENSTWDDNNIFAAKLLNSWEVHGMISGNISPSADVVRSLIKNVGTEEWISRLSSYFLMQTHLWLFLVADAAIQADPNAERLAEIAILTAKSAINYGISPKVAMLSFSTNGSANHDMVVKVQEATSLAKKIASTQNLDFIVEWEMQLDCAVVPEVANLKFPNSKIAGLANILVFPDLNSGNIGYKLMQRFGQAQAIGPIIQGLKKPWNDLSRWCSIDDIVQLYYITANS